MNITTLPVSSDGRMVVVIDLVEFTPKRCANSDDSCLLMTRTTVRRIRKL